MNTLIIIFGLIFTVVCTGLTVWILIINFKEKELPSDDVIFEHFLPQYTDGYTFGSIIEIIRGDKRTGIKFLPKDIDYVKIMKNKEKVNILPQLIWIENSKLYYNSKGVHSSHRHKLWGLPLKAEDLSDDFKQTDIGKMFMNMIENKNMTAEESNVLRKRIQAQTSMLNKTEGLELVEDAILKIMEVNKDIVKTVKEKENKTMSFSNAPGTSH